MGRPGFVLGSNSQSGVRPTRIVVLLRRRPIDQQSWIERLQFRSATQRHPASSMMSPRIILATWQHTACDGHLKTYVSRGPSSLVDKGRRLLSTLLVGAAGRVLTLFVCSARTRKTVCLNNHCAWEWRKACQEKLSAMFQTLNHGCFY